MNLRRVHTFIASGRHSQKRRLRLGSPYVPLWTLAPGVSICEYECLLQERKMRLTLNLAAATLFTFGLLTAAPPPCVTGTLASYVALGANGCAFGRTVFANFGYAGT